MAMTAPSRRHSTAARRGLRAATLVTATGLAAAIALPAVAVPTPAEGPRSQDGTASAARFSTYEVGESRVRLDAARTSATVTNNDRGTPDLTLTPAHPGPRKALDGWKYKLFVPAGKPDVNPPYVSATFTDDSGTVHKEKLRFQQHGAKRG